MGSIKLVQHTGQFRDFVNKEMNFRVPYKDINFLNSCRTSIFSPLHHVVAIRQLFYANRKLIENIKYEMHEFCRSAYVSM